MSIRITQLVPGNEIQGYMTIGRALKVGRNPDGSLFRYVPLKSCMAQAGDLQKFLGQIIYNDIEMLTLTLSVAKMGNSANLLEPQSLTASIAYPLLQKIRILSAINYDPKPKSVIRPNDKLQEYRPYRTISEVILKW
jgi:hypothetical protein